MQVKTSKKMNSNIKRLVIPFLICMSFICYYLTNKSSKGISINENTYLKFDKNLLKDVNVQTSHDDKLNSNANHKTDNQMETEYMMRKVNNDLKELFYFVHNNNQKSDFLEKFDMQLSAATATVEELIEKESMWKKEELQKLSKIVQDKINSTQNPQNCTVARRLTCGPQQICGFGCVAHWMLYCFMISFGTGRTFVPSNQFLKDYSREGWSAALLPLSGSCRHLDEVETGNEDGNVVFELPPHGNFGNHPPHTPIDVPADILSKLEKLHDAPALWWMGQFLMYMMRPKKKLQERIDKLTAKIKHPFVGLHVRRTDKTLNEAKAVDIDQYMLHVEKWYRDYQFKLNANGTTNVKITKRVFLATDEKSIISELEENYPEYEFITDENYQRHSDSGLEQIVSDIEILSQSDYVICTASSNICRMVYELMQTSNEADSSSKFQSLDEAYYYYIQGWFVSTNRVALFDHRPIGSEEIELKVGDVITIPGVAYGKRKTNLLTGWSLGRNARTGKTGIYPSHKSFDTRRFDKRWYRNTNIY